MKATNKKALVAHRIFACVGIGVGVLSMIFGIVVLCWGFSRGSWVDAGIKFNADYYTDSYHAMAMTANNVYRLSYILDVIINAAGYMLIVAGLALMVCFVIKFIATFSQKTVKSTDNEQTIADENNSNGINL